MLSLELKRRLFLVLQLEEIRPVQLAASSYGVLALPHA
jgi:hypothetical protein